MIYKTRTIEIDPTNETLLSVDFGRADAMKFIFDFGSFDTSLAVKSRVFAYRDTDGAYCFGAEFTQAGDEITSSSASASTSASESQSLGSEWIAYFSSVRTSGYSGALRMTVQLVDASGNLINSANILCNVVETNSTEPFEPSPEFRDQVLDALAAAQAAQAAAEAAQTAAETAETNAETAKTAAETAETNAETAQGLAEAAQAAAEAAQSYAETAQNNAEQEAATAEQFALDAASYSVSLDSKSRKAVGRFDLNGGSITIRSMAVGLPVSIFFTVQKSQLTTRSLTATKGTVIFTLGSTTLSLTDGTNTLTASGLSATDALAITLIVSSNTAKIYVNSALVASGTFAPTGGTDAFVLSGSAIVSRMKIATHDASAVGAIYSVAQYIAGIEESPSVRNMTTVINNATLFPVVSAGLYDGWQTASESNCTVAYSGNNLVATQTTNASNYNTGAAYYSTRIIRAGTPFNISIGAGTTTCATACRVACSVVYTDNTSLSLGNSSEGAIGVLPAFSYSGTAAKDIYRITVVVLNNAKLIGETFTWSSIRIWPNGVICSLGDEASADAQIVDDSQNWNHGFITSLVLPDKRPNASVGRDTLKFPNGATGGLYFGGSTDYKPIRAYGYYEITLIGSVAGQVFKVGNTSSSTAYISSITLTSANTPYTTSIFIPANIAPSDMIVTPVSALGAASTVYLKIVRQMIK